VLRALACRISISVISFLLCFYFAKSSSFTVCNTSLVCNPSNCAFVGNSAFVPRIGAVGIKIYHRCKQELTDIIKSKTEWSDLDQWSTQALLIPGACVWLWIAEYAHITFICSSDLSIMMLSQTQLGICAPCKRPSW